MAIRANQIYSRFHDQFDEQDRALIQQNGNGDLRKWLPPLRIHRLAELHGDQPDQERRDHHCRSGMCTGGRIVHHFKHNLWRSECHLVFPGFGAAGTLGRNIVDGAPTVRLLHQRIAVKAKVPHPGRLLRPCRTIAADRLGQPFRLPQAVSGSRRAGKDEGAAGRTEKPPELGRQHP